ncbi:MAG TPA: histidine kinase dimerization/phospho-acceptor domain-containing protein, partial [Burkholderiales bacterium]|nr:histidine kinase dimerization/phospho-acceptor domain-containing protein [Burkholderiales bacterium]
MPASLFAPDIWHTTLDRYAAVTGLSIELFARDGQLVLASSHPTPIVELFRKHQFDPGLFAECAHRSLGKTIDRTAVVVSEEHGLTVVGTSLMLEGAIVGAAVAGYAFTGFSQVDRVQRWARSAGVPFSSLWNIARQLPPMPERRLLLHGELLQVLGDALLRENHRTRQYVDAVGKLQAAIAAKDEFLAVISHELRTPLTPILGWAGVLKKNQDPEQVRRAAGIIERNVLQQKRLIDDLLDMNLTTRGMVKLDLKVVELAPCVLAALETSSEDIDNKAIRLEFADAGAPLYVAADSGRLQQIFRNIISNA